MLFVGKLLRTLTNEMLEPGYGHIAVHDDILIIPGWAGLKIDKFRLA